MFQNNCFECDGTPTAVNMLTFTECCSDCAYAMAEIGIKVKHISKSSFTQQEIQKIQSVDRYKLKKELLYFYNGHSFQPNSRSYNDKKTFLRQKYLERKWESKGNFNSQSSLDDYESKSINEEQMNKYGPYRNLNTMEAPESYLDLYEESEKENKVKKNLDQFQSYGPYSNLNFTQVDDDVYIKPKPKFENSTVRMTFSIPFEQKLINNQQDLAQFVKEENLIDFSDEAVNPTNMNCNYRSLVENKQGDFDDFGEFNQAPAVQVLEQKSSKSKNILDAGTPFLI